MSKQPWSLDLEEFLSHLNPKAKSYQDVKKALEVAWPLAFNKYAKMLVFKDETENQNGLELLQKTDKELDFNEDFEQWWSIQDDHDQDFKDKDWSRIVWEEAYNMYVKYGQTQSKMDEFVEHLRVKE